ncbi:MAG: aminodeoxychorismate/anthranilate synthase component II [Proteobacteria bacterium]|nr:aminodeoxychorismate/anthranilate synthase component II [Desulfobacteraceae bacterium]MBU4012340.1 aminodeoxychorismate/anthranilate synthase component II [Pseudomonadota bacterium]MBU4068606.1 aminodeoxychorismate/anthranilate synthase component II [Pseudomonadota bacterium]MBU4100092.1 aminodeoxychorismate/anthranilate synthase component II [Pseudomonadota bacterium]MBU4125970.1 aminodeoxychorismate/anthranilate synthase component II [Pseudomonadota bacterium]
MIVMIDNYDSFTYNLVQYIEQLGTPVKVFRNDVLSISDLIAMKPSGIVISPGPGRPETAGISLSVVKHFSGLVPILGVCLGHQTIAVAFGGKVISAKQLMHGKTSIIKADGKTLYQGILKPFTAMRYHSLSVSRENLPDCLEISAESDDGEIMGIRHLKHPTEGIQFHPESIMTPVGKRILRSFLKITENFNLS